MVLEALSALTVWKWTRSAMHLSSRELSGLRQRIPTFLSAWVAPALGSTSGLDCSGVWEGRVGFPPQQKMVEGARSGYSVVLANAVTCHAGQWAFLRASKRKAVPFLSPCMKQRWEHAAVTIAKAGGSKMCDFWVEEGEVWVMESSPAGHLAAAVLILML